MDILYFFKDNPNIFLVLITILGLFVGSFLNVLIYRLPRMIQNEWNQECRTYLGLKTNATDSETLNLYLPLSHCTHCKKTIKPWHNIPIISFFLLRGKCSNCAAPISIRYPMVELLCGAASVYVAWRFGFSYQTIAALLFTWIIISLTFIDLDFHLLPDQLTLFLLWAGLFFSLFNIFVSPTDAIIGAMAGYLTFAIIQGLFQHVTGKVGMGQGDFKFLAALGAFLGWQQLPIIILLASMIGVIFGFTHMSLKKDFRSIPLPFGPYLAVAGWISLIWGNEILRLYLYKFMV